MPAVGHNKTVIFSFCFCMQCSMYCCGRFYNENARKVKDFESAVYSYENNTFCCFAKGDKVIRSKSYSTLAFVNGLLWPSLAVIVSGMCILCPCLKALVKHYSSETSAVPNIVIDSERKHRLSRSLPSHPSVIGIHGNRY